MRQIYTLVFLVINMSNLSSTIKFKKTKRNSHGSTIESLPSDLLIEILTQVATSSFTDLFNAKLRYVYNNYTHI